MQIFCDTHVHCYDFGSLPTLLDHALDNFQRVGSAEKNVLFFTDGSVDRTWKKLRPLSDDCYRVKSWELRYSKETQFIHATKGESEILLAPARQINSSTRIEYLILGSDLEIEDGLDDRDLLSQFSSRFAVISPWGVGKWLGQRGMLISQLLKEYGATFLIGDNGGRPSLWAWVPQFSLSKVPAINGSDPLPISGELDRVASYGITLELASDKLSLSTLLSELKLGRHQNYGNSMSLTRFVRGRISMATRR